MTKTPGYTLYLGDNSLGECPRWWRTFMTVHWLNGWDNVEAVLKKYNVRLIDNHKVLVFDRAEDQLHFLLLYDYEVDQDQFHRYLLS